MKHSPLGDNIVNVTDHSFPEYFDSIVVVTQETGDVLVTFGKGKLAVEVVVSSLLQKHTMSMGLATELVVIAKQALDKGKTSAEWKAKPLITLKSGSDWDSKLAPWTETSWTTSAISSVADDLKNGIWAGEKPLPKVHGVALADEGEEEPLSWRRLLGMT